MPEHPTTDARADRSFIPGEDPADFRTRMRAVQHERSAQRERDLAAQAAAGTPPAVRIRMWERLHHATLPTTAGHRLVDVIAAGTKLSPEAVREEQERRRALAAPATGDAGKPVG